MISTYRTLAWVNRFLQNVPIGEMIKNMLFVFIGKNVCLFFELICMWIVISTIGHRGNGVFIMAQTYVLFLCSLLNTSTFNAVIKFMSDALNRKNQQNALEAIKQGYILDFALGLITFAAGVGLAKPLFYLLDIADDTYFLSIVFLSTVIFRLPGTGTATGILRYYNRFDLSVYLDVAGCLLRLVLFSVCWATSGKILHFIIMESVAINFTNIALLLGAWHTLRMNNMTGIFTRPLRINKEFLMFNIYNGLTSSFDSMLTNVSSYFISRFLGYETLSVVKVFEKVGVLLYWFSTPITRIVYPEICRKVSGKDYLSIWRMSTLIVLFFLIAGGVTFCFILTSYNYWASAMLTDVSKLFQAFAIYLSFSWFASSTSLIHLLFMAFDLNKYNTYITFFTNIIYTVFLWLALKEIGLLGYAISRLVQALIVCTCKVIILFRKVHAAFILGSSSYL